MPIFNGMGQRLNITNYICPRLRRGGGGGGGWVSKCKDGMMFYEPNCQAKIETHPSTRTLRDMSLIVQMHFQKQTHPIHETTVLAYGDLT